MLCVEFLVCNATTTMGLCQVFITKHHQAISQSSQVLLYHPLLFSLSHSSLFPTIDWFSSASKELTALLRNPLIRHLAPTLLPPSVLIHSHVNTYAHTTDKLTAAEHLMEKVKYNQVEPQRISTMCK